MSESVIYTSIESIPLDSWDGSDVEDLGPLSSGKDAVEGTYEHGLKTGRMIQSAPLTGRYVPFIREIKLGTIGKDVLAVKRALAKAGFGTWNQWGTRVTWFGPNRVRLLKNFQKKHGLKADGVYGLNTHRKLAPFFDDRGVWLLHHTTLLKPGDAKRNSIVASAMLGYQHRYAIHYTQSGMRMQGVKYKIRPPAYPIWEDCSSFSTWTYWTSGASDPNGLGYNGQGYTGTLWNHGIRVTGDYQKGDLVLYGWGNGIPTHVAIYVGSGRVVSHGSEAGPLLLSMGYRNVTGVRRYF